jgi:aarF domain-containing kinase
LYVKLTPEFRRQYSELWKALLAMDLSTLFRVATEWGIGAPDLFASAVLLRPISFGSKSGNTESKESQPSQYDASMQLKGKLINFFVDTDKMPKELIFVGRNMR